MSRVAGSVLSLLSVVEALNPSACNAPRMSIGGAAAGLLVLPLTSNAQEKLSDNAMSPTLGIESDVDFLSGNEDSIAAIARKTAEKNRAAKMAAIGTQKTEAELLEEQEASKRNILFIAGGGTLASTAFFYKNLQRLATKVLSGGQDSGYGSAQDNNYRRGKKAAPPPPEKSFGAKAFRAAFGRDL